MIADRTTLLLTVEQVAIQLNVSTRTVSRLINSNEFQFVRIGRNIRIPKEELVKYVERRKRYNDECVESAVRNPTGERICRIETPKDVKMAVPTKVRTTRSASPQMEKDFNALLGLNP